VLEDALDRIASLATRTHDCDVAGFISPGSSVARGSPGAGACGRVSDSGKDGDRGLSEEDRRESDAAGGSVGFRLDGCPLGKAILMIEPKSMDRRKPVAVPIPSRDFSLITESPSAVRMRMSE
jgi:hypothetical protein